MAQNIARQGRQDAYLPKQADVPKAAAVIAGLDTLVALLAGLAIFPIVFAAGLNPGEGPGLVFVTSACLGR